MTAGGTVGTPTSLAKRARVTLSANAKGDQACRLDRNPGHSTKCRASAT